MDQDITGDEANKIDREAISQTYNRTRPLYEAVIQEAVFILNSRITEQAIKIHGIEHRAKELQSILDKCSRKNCSDPFAEFVDIAGVRVICLFRPDISTIQHIVSESFDVLDVDDKIAESGNPLGYVSLHMTCKMKSEYRGPRYSAISDLRFEVQLRTLCMHCWAAVSHYLDYKGEWDVPAHMRLSLNALGEPFLRGR